MYKMTTTVNPIIVKSFKVSYFLSYSILASFKVGGNRFNTLRLSCP